MQTLKGFPFAELEFGKDGNPVDPGAGARILAELKADPPRHLLVFSHGWNNNMAQAKDLYERFLDSLSKVAARTSIAGGPPRFAVVGIYWPSIKFDDEALIPGQEAGLGADLDAGILSQLDLLKETVDSPDAAKALQEAKALVPRLEDDAGARKRFMDLVRSALPSQSDDGDLPGNFRDMDGEEAMEALSMPQPVVPVASGDGGGAAALEAGDGSAAGEAAFLGSIFGKLKAGALMAANLTTYYTMKERAGIVGAKGLAPILQSFVQGLPGTTVHLAGHSFGARLVTSALKTCQAVPGFRIGSLSLLQAAFSHHGFALKFDGDRNGFFRPAITGPALDGPVIVTHTPKDRAVGIAYPLASRLARQDAAGIQENASRWGGLGANGARNTPEATDLTMLPVGGPYAFQKGAVYNLAAKAYISGHGDVGGEAVAYAFLRAATA